ADSPLSCESAPDGIFGNNRIRDRPTSFRSPWQNGYVERLIGSIRRECTDQLLVLNATMRFGPTFRSRRMRPADGPSNGSATLSRIRSLADYTIAMLESSFRKRQPPR